MDPVLLLAVMVIAVALVFDFINGFHDAANSVATVVATRVLTPFQAVAWAAFWNFAAAFTFGTGVAKTVGNGMVNLEVVTPYVIMAGLIGAIVWDLLTWWLALPTSSSHALLGGYAGAAMAKVALVKGATSSPQAIVIEGWMATVAFIVVAPILGMVLAYILMTFIHWLFRRASPAKMDRYFRRLQLLSAAIFSYSHGANDAQKTMGIITGVLVTSGYLTTFEIPIWVIFAAHAAIGLGTLSGGWRIIRTMGSRLTKLKPRGGFSAETAAAVSILFSTELKMPVSTTHVVAGAIAGVGSIQRLKAVRWGLATDIVWAWVLTIPAAAFMGALSLLFLRLFTAKV
ncbi:MAG: inorganic phosphate transporter [Acidobacteria bacterium]|nr:inorganic phosphate transporter [Acidobacteriota bacterium]